MPIRNNEKFSKFFLAETNEEAEKLVKKYDYILKMLAHKISNFTGLDREDLYQEGIIGLARANRDFDEERSTNFKIFAIYKIKDAMREFVTTQAISIKAPQYTKDAMRLANMLKDRLIKAGEYQYTALVDMWIKSISYNSDSPLDKSIQKARQSLINLANRSHTSVVQLLERSEVIPSFLSDISMWDNISNDKTAVEEDMINKLYATEIISSIREHISNEEYELLTNRYIKGMTLRELAPIMGISAAHVSDRTQALLQKIRKIGNNLMGKEDLKDECDTNNEEHESRYAS